MHSRSFETPSLPGSLAATHRGFAFYVALPKAPFDLSVYPSMSLASPRLHSARSPRRPLPSMSLVPLAPFGPIDHSRFVAESPRLTTDDQQLTASTSMGIRLLC